jgi:hypothetical protein
MPVAGCVGLIGVLIICGYPAFVAAVLIAS